MSTLKEKDIQTWLAANIKQFFPETVNHTIEHPIQKITGNGGVGYQAMHAICRLDILAWQSDGTLLVVEVKSDTKTSPLVAGVGQLVFYSYVIGSIWPDKKLRLVLATTKVNDIVRGYINECCPVVEVLELNPADICNTIGKL